MAITTTEIESEARDLSLDAQAFQVATKAEYEAAGDFLTGVIKPYQRRVADTFKPMKKATHDAHKEVLAQEKKHLAPAQEAERIVKSKMLAWAREEKQRAEEEQRRREAEERKRAEERQLADAQAAEDAGDEERVDRILTQERPAPIVEPVAAAPKVAGVSIRQIWKYEITDADEIPREFLKVDEAKLRKYVQTMKGDARVAGVRVYSEDSMAARA